MMQLKKLGEVCGFVRGPFGGSLKKENFVEKGFAVYEQQHAIYNQFSEIRYFIDENKFNEMRRFELKENDLIMSCSGTMGKVAIVPKNIQKGIINQALLKLTPKSGIEIEYLKYWMSSPDFEKRIEENTVGAAIKNVASVKILKEIELPIPSLKEQKQIVAILDEAFEAIDKAKSNIEKNIENAKELFQAKLEIVFKEILINHGEYSLNSFCEVKDGTHDSPKYVNENGIPFVTQKNVTVFGLDFSDVKLISKTDHDNFYRRSNVALGDILISMIGANRGMACLVNDKRLFSIKNVGLIKENKDKYNSDYLLFFLKSNLAKKYVSENSSGSAQGFIGLTKLREFPIPFTDLRAQNKIADELVRFESSTRKCIERYNQKILMLESLKKSILQKAFTGELIVDKVGV